MTIHHDTFAGVYPAMTTPFTEDDAVDHEQLAADARRLADAGVDGLVPVGSTGESATLTHAEHAEVVETVVDAVDVPVVAGSGSNSTHEAVDLSERAADAGADADGRERDSAVVGTYLPVGPQRSTMRDTPDSRPLDPDERRARRVSLAFSAPSGRKPKRA